MNKADATMWNDLIVYELASGTCRCREVKYDPDEKQFKTTPVGTVEIPVGSMSGFTPPLFLTICSGCLFRPKRVARFGI